MSPFKVTDVVAVLKTFPDQNLSKGQVGAIVEVLNDGYYEVEFTDKTGQTIATLPVSAQDLMLLHFEAEKA